MRIIHTLPVMAFSMALAACGSGSEEPKEQIVVREPGEIAAPAATTAGGAATDASELVSSGKAAFGACSVCHSVDSNEPSGIGPNLYGVVGRNAGAAEEFGYSDALAQSGIIWTEDELDAFLTNPSAKVPGTIMTAGAVGDADKRTAIIAYLSSLQD